MGLYEPERSCADPSGAVRSRLELHGSDWSGTDPIEVEIATRVVGLPTVDSIGTPTAGVSVRS